VMGLGIVVTDCHGLIGFVPLTLPCTVYDVMGLPPSDAGGFHDKSTLFNPDCAVKSVGASGIIAGVAMAVSEKRPEAGPS